MKMLGVVFVILSILFAGTASQAEVFTVIRKINVGSKAQCITLGSDGRNVVYYVQDSEASPLSKSRMLKSSSGGSLWINKLQVSSDHIGLPIGLIDLTISPDGSKVGYFATMDGAKWACWINHHKISPEFDGGWVGSFSPDGKKLGYLAKDREKLSVWIDDKKVSGEFNNVWPPLFGPDGKDVAYVANKGSKYSVWINDRKASPEFDMIIPTISYDGTACVYVALIEGSLSIMKGDRKVSAEFDLPSGHIPLSAVFRHESGKVAYVLAQIPAQKSAPLKYSSSVWINGIKITPPNVNLWLTLLGCFNFDGGKVAYRTITSEGTKWSIWINDKKVTPEFDEVSLSKEHFAKTGKLLFAGYDKTKDEILIMQGN